jgi:hypothetical protein
LLLARPVSLPPTLPETDAQLAPDAPGSESARQLSLSDGSTLYLSAGSRAQVVTMTQVEVRVRLDRGSVECEVQPVPERRFVVEAAGFEVVVKGTHFTVSLGGEQIIDGVSVSVERGSVEVREPPDRVLALLGPGQLWSSERNGASPEAVSPAVVSPPAAVPLVVTAPGPRVLFERANAARLRGDSREAAAAFDELRRRHPADARAGYAAFLLGRLRLDTLGDAKGAVEALSFAVAHPGSGFFQEDAEVRLIEALAKAGQAADCRQARDRFLARHPQAPGAKLVTKRCNEQ